MRKRITYANVAATLALVFSMSGGALAAKHYLVNSTKQISPTVLKKLKGATGKTGATGTAGTPGAPGAKGETGKEGPAGPYPTVLGSKQTENGVWGGGYTAVKSGDGYRVTASFPIPLGAAVPLAHVVYVSGTSATHCPGMGQAEAGFLCLYQGYIENGNTPLSGNIFDPESGEGLSDSAGSRGFEILLSAQSPGSVTVSGTFAGTAQ
jgi:hypothetical protein